jgi:hypothetical protein
MEAMPVSAPCCGSGEIVGGGVVYEGSPSDFGAGGAMMVNEAGEQIVPGSVQIVDDGSSAVSGAVETAEAPTEAATDGI